MIKQYDLLVVGAGLYGALYAYLCKKAGQNVLVIDKRSQPGGNLLCKNIEGINVHLYGPHIFHTSNRKVWNFVNSFVEFNRYTNSPLAMYNGKLYNLPFNMNTFHQLWGVITPEQAESELNRQRQEIREKMQSQGIKEPRNLEEQALLLAGKDVYEILIKGYTEKQWGRPASKLPAFIIKRLPFRLVYDNNYFNDSYQGIPIGGYNRLIDSLLDGIEVKCGEDFLLKREHYSSVADKILYTGKIDEYYNFRFGNLEYRSLRFEHETIDCPNYQGNAIVNYTQADIPFTRIIEHKHFEQSYNFISNPSNASCKTVITREYPEKWGPGMEPYYPVNDATNNAIYAKYSALAQNERNVEFGGRLGEYKYYDMNVIVEKLLK